jgi:hypothetical protein
MEINIHKTVIINKPFHYFSTVYFEKNMGAEWTFSLVFYTREKLKLYLPFPTMAIYMMNGRNVCMASLSQFLQLYILSSIQDTVHLLQRYH